MNRRVFLRESIMGAAVVGFGAAGLWGRCAWARSRVVQQLMDGALPVLDKHALQELDEIPKSTSEKVRAYFDGLNLNLESFLGEVSKSDFRVRLSKIKTPERRHHELLAVFYRRLAAPEELSRNIHGIIVEVGPQVDKHWSDCCTEIAKRWELRFQSAEGRRFDGDAFLQIVTPNIRAQMEQSVRQARHAADDPGWRESMQSLGAQALDSVQDMTIEIGGRSVALPECIVSGSRRALGKVLEVLGDSKVDCQRMLSERMKHLAEETASGLEKELRSRLNDLHSWREQAVRRVAEQHAAEHVGLLGEHA